MKNGKSLDAGEVTITLGDESIILRPTMRAAMMINRQFGGYAKARQNIVDENFDTVVFIIRIGSGMDDKSARRLEDRVWHNGLDFDLLRPLIEYVAILNNGGRPLPTMVDGDYDVVDGSSSSQIEDHRESGNG